MKSLICTIILILISVSSIAQATESFGSHDLYAVNSSISELSNTVIDNSNKQDQPFDADIKNKNLLELHSLGVRFNLIKSSIEFSPPNPNNPIDPESFKVQVEWFNKTVIQLNKIKQIKQLGIFDHSNFTTKYDSTESIKKAKKELKKKNKRLAKELEEQRERDKIAEEQRQAEKEQQAVAEEEARKKAIEEKRNNDLRIKNQRELLLSYYKSANYLNQQINDITKSAQERGNLKKELLNKVEIMSGLIKRLEQLTGVNDGNLDLLKRVAKTGQLEVKTLPDGRTQFSLNERSVVGKPISTVKPTVEQKQPAREKKSKKTLGLESVERFKQDSKEFHALLSGLQKDFEADLSGLEKEQKLTHLDYLNRMRTIYAKGESVIKAYNQVMQYRQELSPSDLELVKTKRGAFLERLNANTQLKSLVSSHGRFKITQSQVTANKFLVEEIEAEQKRLGNRESLRWSLEESIKRLKEARHVYLTTSVKRNVIKKSNLFDTVYNEGRRAAAYYNRAISEGVLSFESDKAGAFYREIVNTKLQTGIDFVTTADPDSPLRAINLSGEDPERHKHKLLGRKGGAQMPTPGVSPSLIARNSNDYKTNELRNAKATTDIVDEVEKQLTEHRTEADKQKREEEAAKEKAKLALEIEQRTEKERAVKAEQAKILEENKKNKQGENSDEPTEATSSNKDSQAADEILEEGSSSEEFKKEAEPESNKDLTAADESLEEGPKSSEELNQEPESEHKDSDKADNIKEEKGLFARLYAMFFSSEEYKNLVDKNKSLTEEERLKANEKLWGQAAVGEKEKITQNQTQEQVFPRSIEALTPENETRLNRLGKGFGGFMKTFITFYGMYWAADLAISSTGINSSSDPTAKESSFDNVFNPTVATIIGGTALGAQLAGVNKNVGKYVDDLNQLRMSGPKLAVGVAGATFLMHAFSDLIFDLNHGELNDFLFSDDPAIEERAWRVVRERYLTKDQYLSYTPYMLSIATSMGLTSVASLIVKGSYNQLSQRIKVLPKNKTTLKKLAKDGVKKVSEVMSKSGGNFYFMMGRFIVIMAVDTVLNPVFEDIYKPLNFYKLGMSVSDFTKQNRERYSQHVSTMDDQIEEMAKLDEVIFGDGTFSADVLAKNCSAVNSEPKRSTHGHARAAEVQKANIDRCQYDANPELIVSDEQSFNEERKQLILSSFEQNINNWKILTMAFSNRYSVASNVYRFFYYLKENQAQFTREQIEHYLSQEFLYTLMSEEVIDASESGAGTYSKKYNNLRFSHIIDYTVFQMACGVNLDQPDLIVRQRDGYAIEFNPPAVARVDRQSLCNEQVINQFSRAGAKNNYGDDYNDVFASFWKDHSGTNYSNLALLIFDNLANLKVESDEWNNTYKSNEPKPAAGAVTNGYESSELLIYNRLKPDESNDTKPAAGADTNGDESSDLTAGSDTNGDESSDLPASAEAEEELVSFLEYKLNWWDSVIHPMVQNAWSSYDDDYKLFMREQYIKPMVGNSLFEQLFPGSAGNLSDEQVENEGVFKKSLNKLYSYFNKNEGPFKSRLNKLYTSFYKNEEGLMYNTYVQLERYHQRILALAGKIGQDSDELISLGRVLEKVKALTVERRENVAYWDHESNPIYPEETDIEAEILAIQGDFNKSYKAVELYEPFYNKEYLNYILHGQCSQAGVEDYFKSKEFDGAPSENFTDYKINGDSYEVIFIGCDSKQQAKSELVKATEYRVLVKLMEGFHNIYNGYFLQMAPFLNNTWY